MLSKAGFQLALSPQRPQDLDVIVMRLPFQEEGILRVIWIWSQEWDAHHTFECCISVPVTRDDDRTKVCYNGAHVQRMHIEHRDKVVFGLHCPEITDSKIDQDFSKACYSMSTAF